MGQDVSENTKHGKFQNMGPGLPATLVSFLENVDSNIESKKQALELEYYVMGGPHLLN